MFERSRITFRPLEPNDLMLMYQWLRLPAVSNWYGPPPATYAEVEGRYISRMSGAGPVRGFIVEYDAIPIGYIQMYRIDHDADYAAALNVDRDAVGVDLFIGEETYRYRGFGGIMLREFVRRLVFTEPSISCCIVAPAVSNRVAIHAYRKAGFRHVKTVPVPGEDESEYVMILWPDELPENSNDEPPERKPVQ